MQSPNGHRSPPPTPVPITHAPITISYADDGDVLYWRCEAEDCPSRIAEAGMEPAPFVGTITYTDPTHGHVLLGAVAVAHATLLDQAPLGELRETEIVEA
jgi:hypothetical protein